MNTIHWGIIGCGDVTEVKSGPAFNKVPDSTLTAVMRRNATRAQDYARRHQVPVWYSDAHLLINDPRVNAIYVATPPSSHEEYALAALAAGKPVYLEKPMTLDAKQARSINEAVTRQGGKLVVAHYRREQPVFKKIKQLLDENAIGDVRLVKLDLFKPPLTAEELATPKTAWRVDRSIAGGGLFHDLAPHQIDLLYYFFGEVESSSGTALNQGRQYETDDMVAGTILFKNGVLFSGAWCFNVSPDLERDQCEIIGSKGKISFSVFDHQLVEITRQGKTETISFDKLAHVQQPMIERVVNYFLGRATNPCSAADGLTVMELLDSFTKRS
jgi:predicted dehydrogenase